ncbi:unnamed protein product [Symbiodinium natans]|uniref:Uncharacterized protein n=1 Tax=Symbiodinium natans TaxID=878477 RepID=A0A812Q2H9_9DINO|nr:unnamed protein product [Symbiodinium natans]
METMRGRALMAWYLRKRGASPKLCQCFAGFLAEPEGAMRRFRRSLLVIRVYSSSETFVAIKIRAVRMQKSRHNRSEPKMGPSYNFDKLSAGCNSADGKVLRMCVPPD